jgi:hypothetical protein
MAGQSEIIDANQQINEVLSAGHGEQTGGKLHNIWLILITAILFLLLVLNTYQFIAGKIVSGKRVEVIKSVERYIEFQSSFIKDLTSDYEDSVYDDPSVETINQQLFRAQEYTFMTLQIIAEQNNHIIELLATLP